MSLLCAWQCREEGASNILLFVICGCGVKKCRASLDALDRPTLYPPPPKPPQIDNNGVAVVLSGDSSVNLTWYNIIYVMIPRHMKWHDGFRLLWRIYSRVFQGISWTYPGLTALLTVMTMNWICSFHIEATVMFSSSTNIAPCRQLTWEL